MQPVLLLLFYYRNYLSSFNDGTCKWCGVEKMANIYLSWLFPCLVGAIRTARCIPFAPIISAISEAQPDSSRAINTSPGPHTASTSSPRHSLMTGKKHNGFLLSFHPSFSCISYRWHKTCTEAATKLHVVKKVH